MYYSVLSLKGTLPYAVFIHVLAITTCQYSHYYYYYYTNRRCGLSDIFWVICYCQFWFFKANSLPTTIYVYIHIHVHV